MIHPQPNSDPFEEFNDYDDEDYVPPEELPQEMSRVHSDSELEEVIKELLHNSQKIDASDITVIVDNCHVKLSGTVKSDAERDYALAVTKLVHGVGEVENNLIVKINEGILPTDIGRNP